MSDMSAVENSSPIPFSLKLDQSLEQAQVSVASLGDDFSGYRAEFDTIRQRLGEGLFHLAVLGQFKRGKSTLLNALLGDDLLPTDILPVTAIPTFIQSGPQVGAKVYFLNSSEPREFVPEDDRSLAEFLREYVTEAGNPHNKYLVSRVEISHPAPLLQQGVVLVDTPGVGSTHKHNTEIAHQILPQCDAALFLVSPDPPITEMELDYLKEIKQRLPRTFYLLNKVDFLDEQEQKTSLCFLADQLSGFYDSPPQVMPISARKGLQARLAGDETGWRKSGMQLVEQNLIDFFAREKQQILHQALGRRTTDLLGDVCMQIQLSLTALKLPVDELAQRIEQFRRSLPEIERQQQAVEDVLAGDRKRLLQRLTELTEALRNQAKKRILNPLEGHLETVEDPEEMERLVRQAIAAETVRFFVPALRRTAETVRREATEVLTISQQQSNRLIEKVRQTAAELFDIPYRSPIASNALVPFEVPSWSDDLFTSDMDPLGQKLSRKLLSKKFRRRRTVKRLREESRKLLNQNVAQVNWALQKSLEESVRKFGAELREQLEKTITATRQAMEVALQRSESHSREVADAEVRLQQALQTLQTIRAGLID